MRTALMLASFATALSGLASASELPVNVPGSARVYYEMVARKLSAAAALSPDNPQAGDKRTYEWTQANCNFKKFETYVCSTFCYWHETLFTKTCEVPKTPSSPNPR